MNILVIKFESISLRLALKRSSTADAIIAAAPFESTVQCWGQEVIFDCPINVPLENNAKNIVDPGEIAYWTEGSCIAIGFGPTPLSKSNEIRLANRCNIWADAIDDVKQLAKIRSGSRIRIECQQITSPPAERIQRQIHENSLGIA